MKRSLVYDVPTRVFHWLFAALFVTAFVIAKNVDDDSQVYAYHMIAGLTLSALVVARGIWGLVGSTHARFSNFALKPSQLVAYLTGILRGRKDRWAGHNPASSWAALIMMTLALALATTGTLMASGVAKSTLEDIHELVANAFVLVVFAHIAGLVLHTLRFRELIGLSMWDGRKAHVSPEDQIAHRHYGAGLALLILVLLTATFLLRNFDARTGRLNALGLQLKLLEIESADEGASTGEETRD